ncbi:MAG: Crp/Fnr family transcriptional regulator [Aquificota bacterium]|nr:MAG: Crp/Fnr family transcriptional regulator [Aquificota bacterium]
MLKEILRECKLFKGLNEKLINELLNYIEKCSYKKGEFIIWKGEENTDMYIILDGKVNVMAFDEKGNELILTTLYKGDIVGELSLVDGKPRSMSVEAITNVEVAVLKRKYFLEVAKKYPELCLNLAKNLAEKIRETDKMLEYLVFLDVKRRIIKFFIENNIGKENNNYKINKMTHSEIAKRIGASREAVTKAMKNLIKNKVLLEKENFYILKSNSIYEE